MVKHTPIDDPVLGHLKFDKKHNHWSSHFAMPDGRNIRLSIIPEDHREPLVGQGLSQIRETIIWLREHDAKLRMRIADRLFESWKKDWGPDEEDDAEYDDEDEIPNPQTPADFANLLSLSGVNIYEDLNADVFYDDGDLYAGHSVYLTIASDGSTVFEPKLYG